MSVPPKLAVFPKAYMEPLFKTGHMKLADWIDLAGELPIDGLEFYCGILDLADSREWPTFRKMAEDKRVDPAMAEGSGPHGRIERTDVAGLPRRGQGSALPRQNRRGSRKPVDCFANSELYED